MASAVARISKTFNANLAPILVDPIRAATDPKAMASAAAQDSVQKAAPLAKNIEAVQSVLGNKEAASSPSGMNVLGAVGFAVRAVVDPVGTGFDVAAKVAKSMSTPQEEPSQFYSAAEMDGDDIMAFENRALLEGNYSTVMGDQSHHGGIMQTMSNPLMGVGQYVSDTQAPVLSGKDRKNAESALGAMEKQFEGLQSESDAAQKFARQEGMGGLPTNGVKMPGGDGNPSSGWTKPSPSMAGPMI